MQNKTLILKLIAAIKSDDFLSAKSCIDQGVDVNACSGAALTQSAQTGNVKIMQLLISYGADVNQQSNAALRFAIQKGNLGVIQVLVCHGANAQVGLEKSIESENEEAKNWISQYVKSQDEKKLLLSTMKPLKKIRPSTVKKRI